MKRFRARSAGEGLQRSGRAPSRPWEPKRPLLSAPSLPAPTPRSPRTIVALASARRAVCLPAALSVFLLCGACAPAHRGMTPLERSIAAAARPILEMDPDALWTDSYNQLVQLAPASIEYLAEHPTLRQPAAPDDLRVMLHTSLLRLLAHPATRPRLSANCLETTLDLLHFDLKVGGRRIGTPCLPTRRLPGAWHELYPADFDHRLADHVDAEADRRAMRLWWRTHRDRTYALTNARRLKPRAHTLWRLLGRRYADRWTYQPLPRVIRCAAPPDAVMISAPTCDYNLVRAACLWLGSSGQPEIRDGLISLVASPSPIVLHNAFLALQYDPDQRIRDVLQRYKNLERSHPAPLPPDRDPPSTITRWKPVHGDTQAG